MNKLSILISIFLLSIIPSVNTQAQTTYCSPTWSAFEGSSFPTYAASTSCDIDGFSSVGIYIDETVADEIIFSAVNPSTGADTLVSRVNVVNGSTTEFELRDIYDTEPSGIAVFKVPSGSQELNIVLGSGGMTAQQFANLLNSANIFIFEVAIGSNINESIAYQNGIQLGYQQALEQIKDDVNIAYAEGYTEGQLDSDNSTLAIATFIPQVLALSFGFFFQVFSVEVMGISVLQWFAALMTVSMGIIIFRTLLK